MYVRVLEGGERKPAILDIIFWKFSTFPKLPLTTDQEVLDIYHNKHRIRGASQVAERLKTSYLRKFGNITKIPKFGGNTAYYSVFPPEIKLS